jgi:hypothetical protein
MKFDHLLMKAKNLGLIGSFQVLEEATTECLTIID